MEHVKLKCLFSSRFWKVFNKKNNLNEKNKKIGIEYSRFMFKQILEGLDYSKYPI